MTWSNFAQAGKATNCGNRKKTNWSIGGNIEFSTTKCFTKVN